MESEIQNESDSEEVSDSFPKGLEQYEEKSKPNLEETEIVNIGTETEVKEIKMSIHLNALTMEHDCIDFVKRCIKCQVHGDVIRAPPTELHSMAAPWPCSMWGMDVIGTIDPPVSNGHRFILVAIEYFTKWVEAESFKHVTKKVVANFLKDHIICRFSVPETLITDNAKNLNNDMVDGLCEQLKIKHRNSAIYRPQMNGAVEAANKNLKKIIRKMTEKHRDWHEKLPYALMPYRASIRTSTGATPYSLIYGMEVVLPAEVEIPSLRILMEAKVGRS
nr:uncharacterized protein K02A2.6-like [Coffea arabica]XP_027100998.1 uncharacterized protein K02A2.6-like [Coffea arabica]